MIGRFRATTRACDLHFPPLPMPNSFHKLPLEGRVAAAYDILEQLRRPNGGYIASPYSADDGSGDAYNVFWIRDIMFATYANEYLGCFDKMVSSFRLVMDIFKRHHLPIIRASVVKPHLLNERGKFMPARVHPASLETITEGSKSDEKGKSKAHNSSILRNHFYRMNRLLCT
jgi:hypothetical protein